VVPAKQIYHCFSCGAGGNALTFVMEYHKMAFREALEHLAQRAGVELTPWKPGAAAGAAAGSQEQRGGGASRQEVLAANRAAADFFERMLAREDLGRAAREVIARRGISPEMVESFRLGAAPEMWDGLQRTISHKNAPAGPFLAAGLLKQRNEGGLYDAFRNRLMFPIQDQTGAVVAFGARRINEEDEPKYLNSPDSVVFNKSATLYGLHQAARTIQRTRTAIVTEGYMDVIACHQAGVTNAVAALGTAMTRENAKILRRLCDTVVLLFDGDEAGQRAADRAVEVFFAEPVDVRIAVLPPDAGAKDPDELLKQEGGRERFDRMIDDAVEALSYRLARLKARIGGLGLSARARAVEEEMAHLVELGLNEAAPVRRQLIIRRIAALLEIDEDTLRGTIPQRRRAPAAQPSSTTGPAATDAGAANTAGAPGPASELLLGCVLADPTLVMSLEGGVDELRELLAPPAANPRNSAFDRVVACLCELLEGEDEGQPGLRDVLARLDDASAQRLATGACGYVEVTTDSDRDRLHQLWREQVTRARRDLVQRHAQIGDEQEGEQDAWLAEIKRLQDDYATLGENPAAMPTGGL
jgi:DNA primase